MQGFAKELGISVGSLRWHISKGRIRTRTREVLGIAESEKANFYAWKGISAPEILKITPPVLAPANTIRGMMERDLTNRSV